MPYSFNANFLKQPSFMQLLLSSLPFFIESEAAFNISNAAGNQKIHSKLPVIMHVWGMGLAGYRRKILKET
jgi:hypothetical protein